MPYQYGMQNNNGLPSKAVQRAVGASPDFPVVGNGLGGLPVRTSSGDIPLFWVYTSTSGTDQFNLTAYHPSRGLIGTQLVQAPTGFGSIATSNTVFSADGKYLVTSMISGTDYYVGVFDTSRGPGNVFYVDRLLISGGTAISNIRISPRGRYISCTTTIAGETRYHIYDCTNGFSSATLIGNYLGNSFTTFSPRGFTFTPSGNTGYSAGSSEGGSVLIPSLTRVGYSWGTLNQTFRGYSNDGNFHLYFGQANQAAQTPLTRVYAFNSSTQIRTLGPDIFPTSVSPVAGVPHVAGRVYVSDGALDTWVSTSASNAAAGYLRIIDYSNGTTILTSPYYSDVNISPCYLLNGDLVHWNATAGVRQVLRPSNAYSDVTALYSAATLAVVSTSVANSTPNTNCWPAFGKQTLYSTI